jgi:hypothetical protein
MAVTTSGGEVMGGSAMVVDGGVSAPGIDPTQGRWSGEAVCAILWKGHSIPNAMHQDALHARPHALRASCQTTLTWRGKCDGRDRASLLCVVHWSRPGHPPALSAETALAGRQGCARDTVHCIYSTYCVDSHGVLCMSGVLPIRACSPHPAAIRGARPHGPQLISFCLVLGACVCARACAYV